MKPSATVGTVAVIMAAALAVAFITITSAVMWDAVRSDTPGLSENATQILTGWGGGIIGVLGGYIGHELGKRTDKDDGHETAGKSQTPTSEPINTPVDDID